MACSEPKTLATCHCHITLCILKKEILPYLLLRESARFQVTSRHWLLRYNKPWFNFVCSVLESLGYVPRNF